MRPSLCGAWGGEMFPLLPSPKRRDGMSTRTKTPTFVLELPLQVDAQQAKHQRAHFEAGRCLYNALLGEAMKRLRAMRADPAWQEARDRQPTNRSAEKHSPTHGTGTVSQSMLCMRLRKRPTEPGLLSISML